MGFKAGIGPQGWDLGLEAGIWALSLGSESEGRGMKRRRGRRRRRRKKSPFKFYHNLLRQGTGTGDHLTLLRLFFKCHVKKSSL